MPSTVQKDMTDRIMHYRLVNALARQESQCPAPADNNGVRWRNRLGLASIATAMNVPAAIATFRDNDGEQSFTSHGLESMPDLARFVAACHALCVERVVVIPDTRSDPALAMITRLWPSDDFRFLVGIPLRDLEGQRVGSLAVMNSSRSVARTGICFRTLTNVGKVYAETGLLQPQAAKAA